MRTFLRPAIVVLVGVLALTGCTATPDAESPDTTAATAVTTQSDALTATTAGWFTSSLFAVRLWDEHCGTQVDAVEADGQTVSVRVSDMPLADCAFANPRHGLAVEVPAGVDTRLPVDIVVTDPHGGVSLLTLPGLEQGAVSDGAEEAPGTAIALLGGGEVAVRADSECAFTGGYAEPLGAASAIIRIDAVAIYCGGTVLSQVAVIDVPAFDDDVRWWVQDPDGEDNAEVTIIR